MRTAAGVHSLGGSSVGFGVAEVDVGIFNASFTSLRAFKSLLTSPMERLNGSPMNTWAFASKNDLPSIPDL